MSFNPFFFFSIRGIDIRIPKERASLANVAQDAMTTTGMSGIIIGVVASSHGYMQPLTSTIVTLAVMFC
jgi:hypothetical protein